MSRQVLALFAALGLAAFALPTWLLRGTASNARAAEGPVPSPPSPDLPAATADPGSTRSPVASDVLELAPPSVLPTATDLVEGSPAWDRYLVWDADYYATSDPSRIHVERPWRPGELRTPLVALTPRVGFGRPDHTYPGPLAVRARPGVPVTFYAPDWGNFPGGRRSITVESNAEGVATTTFTFWQSASYYRVVAASPVHTGVVVFELQALDPAEWERHQELLGTDIGGEG